ncbi:MAG: hypothetical protein WC985_09005 [Thermoplasmata archaeon]
MVNLESVVVVLAILLAILHVAVAARSGAKFHEQAGQLDEVLAYGWGLKGFATGVTLIWAALFLVTTRGLQNLSEWTPSGFFIVAVILLALVLPLWAFSVEVFGAEYHVTPDGIRKHSPWTRNFFARWDEIESVSRNQVLEWTTIRTTNGKIRVHDYIGNRFALLKALVDSVPRERVGRLRQ